MDFFNDLSKKFSHAARTIQERTMEGVESTRLSADLRAARSELERSLAELGRAYYESITLKDREVPAELVRRVRDGMDLVESLTAQRDRASRQARCPGCGSVQSEEARYCSNCGRPMPEKVPAPAEEPAGGEAQFCEACGAMRQGQAKFCALCGAAYEPEAAAALTVPKAPEAPKPEALEEPESEDPYAE